MVFRAVKMLILLSREGYYKNKKSNNWVFENFILPDEPFAKVLGILETCVSVKNNLCEKFVLSLESPTTFDERFQVTWAAFFLFQILIYWVVS